MLDPKPMEVGDALSRASELRALLLRPTAPVALTIRLSLDMGCRVESVLSTTPPVFWGTMMGVGVVKKDKSISLWAEVLLARVQ